MDIQEEEQLAKSFFMKMSAEQLAYVPNEYWRFSTPQDHLWYFEVLPGQLEKHPYRFSLHFDQRNRVVTFSLLQQQVRTMRIFPHLYFGFVEYLTSQEVDCIVRNEDECVKEKLYQNKKVPFHSTGVMSQQIEGLAEKVVVRLYQGKLYFWQEGCTVQLASSFVSPMFWEVQFIYDESRKDAQGRLEVAGIEVTNEQDIQFVFGEVEGKIREVLLLEQSIIDRVNRLATTSYYDPTSRSMKIFGKEVPFNVHLIRGREGQAEYRYAVKFAQTQIESTDESELLEKTNKVCEEYIKSERLRAALEGRA